MNNQRVKCHWCGAPAKRVYKDFPSKKRDIYVCERCNIMFQYPMPSEEEIRLMYSSEYFSSWGEDRELEKTKKRDFEEYVKLVENYVEVGEKTLLDLGAAQGFLLEVAEQRGWMVTGVEMSKEVKPYNEEIRKKIIYGDFLNIDFSKNKFTAVTSISVFEHIREPIRFTEKVRNILKPGGIWLILVPNVGSFQRKVLGKKWPHFNNEHLFYYNRDFFRYMAEKYDFELVLEKIPLTNYTLFYLFNQIKKNSRSIFPSLANFLLKIVPSFLLNVNLRISGGNLLVVLRKRA